MANPVEIPHLDKVVSTLVAAAEPTKIVLFGSHARGEAEPDSDIDLLVVTDRFQSRRGEMVRLRRAVRQFRLPIDVVVVSSDEVTRFGDTPGHVLYPALREGRLLYERRGR